MESGAKHGHKNSDGTFGIIKREKSGLKAPLNA